MDENEPKELSEQEADEILREAIGDSAEKPPISEAKANRFYDRLRTKIASYMQRGKAPSAARDALLFAPDTFILLTRLARDPRVTGKNKVILGSAIAYFIFPLDFFSEAVFGPIGYLDDLI
ncbi:MAG: YkvA family protein, partial [Thermoanaerobaculia bacterium]